ncbi:MAG: response regulator [Helicobacteraceae bacterium]|nr:response regulator [Helicobacteraceae bacterium]
MKVFLLEDEVMLNSAITEYLNIQGHIVTSMLDGEEALKELLINSYDLLILDINVPTLDGLELLKILHENKVQTPAIYISALVDIEEITKAYDLGCYDYIKKPFHLKELSLRIEKVLQSTKVPQNHIKLSYSYSYDTNSKTLYFSNNAQTITKKQQDIIDTLAKNRSRVVDFDLFREYVWSENYVDNSTIRAEINRLKKSLKEDFILNIRSVGYMIE